MRARKPGEIGALMRREGLYSSHLGKWREQRDRGALGALERASRAVHARPSAEAVEIREAAWRARSCPGRSGDGSPGDRGAGKRLRALGGAADQERDGNRRAAAIAMIDQAITEIEPMIGTLAGVPGARRLTRGRVPPAAATARAGAAPPPAPARALSEPERARVLEQLHAERFVDSSPAEVWATLLDEGTYLASERTMYRLLAADGQVRERRDQLTHPPYARPELLAERPNRGLERGTSRSCSARRRGRTSTSTRSSTCSAATSSAGPCSTARPARSPSS